jgi:hypothetical protein
MTSRLTGLGCDDENWDGEIVADYLEQRTGPGAANFLGSSLCLYVWRILVLEA